MKVRTNLEVNCNLLTEKQWAKKGYLKNENTVGKELWTNQYCHHTAIYFSEAEMHKATPEELAEYFRPERERKAARRKDLAEKKKAKTEQYIQQMKECISVLEKTAWQLSRQIEIEPEIRSDVIVIDTETTGLNVDEDELLQISIIDGEGRTLYNSYLKPLYVSEWIEAMKINHITPEMVADAPNIYQEIPKINGILRYAKKIVGYNHIGFDIPFLENFGAAIPEDAELIDVMLAFAPVYGEFNEHYGDYKWQKLAACAAYYNYDWGEDKAHDSLADCRATLHCYKAMQN